ncbi:hypothetical protein EDC94DRAFT_604344 [Helicostylum pulchrum]|nr:hypothetical protein EDC94DRAFT_604344 [Helicostylum pulchrum]
MSDGISKRALPDDIDLPATIVLYVILIILGVGMCFCLRRANRLIPNRFSFPLVDRAEERQRGQYDVATEEEGLLSDYSDMEDTASTK